MQQGRGDRKLGEQHLQVQDKVGLGVSAVGVLELQSPAAAEVIRILQVAESTAPQTSLGDRAPGQAGALYLWNTIKCRYILPQ